MEAFRFQCQRGCVRCCEAPGVVRLAPGDEQQAADFLGLPLEKFRAQYVMMAADGRFLLPVAGTRCPFLQSDGCAIHEAKPTQCRLYPFWPEIVETRQSWRQTVELCPGIGSGALVTISAAVKQAQEMKRAFPDTYGL